MASYIDDNYKKYYSVNGTVIRILLELIEYIKNKNFEDAELNRKLGQLEAFLSINNFFYEVKNEG